MNRKILHDIISVIIAISVVFCMFVTPLVIARGFSGLTYQVMLQNEVLYVIGAELKLLNANGQKAMQGAGIMPAKKTEVGE